MGSKNLRAALQLRDDDDLLRFQEQFLADKQAKGAAPAAQVKRVAPPSVRRVERDVVSLDHPSMPALSQTKPAAEVKPKSKFAQARALQASKNNPSTVTKPKETNTQVVHEIPDRSKSSQAGDGGGDDGEVNDQYFVDDDGEVYVDENSEEDPYLRMERSDAGMSSVLARIQEHDSTNFTYQFPTHKTTPFPEVPHRSKFAQRMKAAQAPPQVPESTPTASKSGILYIFYLFCKVAIIILHYSSTSPYVSKQIHEENEQKISSMSVNEIAEAQQDILRSLDPSLINMLRNRKSGKSTSNTATQQSTQPVMNPVVPPAVHPVVQPVVQSVQPTQPPQQVAQTSAPEAQTKPNVKQNVRFAASELEPQPLKKLTKAEREEQTRKKQAMRKNQQEVQKLEMLEQFEKDNKSIIVMAEGPKVDGESSSTTSELASTDVTTWRFDFNGNLVVKGSDVPTHTGLHHHGDEQSEAGYTLTELHSLARSTFPGQKALALKIIALVIRNSSSGKFKRDVLSYIVSLKIPRLLRTCLDDINPSIIASTVDALHALVVDDNWERHCKELSNRYRGNENLPLHPIIPHSGKIGPAPKLEEDPELDDDELLKQDLVKGLLRANLLNRLRYILEVVRLPNVVLPILELLTHMARHSVVAAKEIFECSRLVDCIVSEFVLVNSGSDSPTAEVPYSTPLVQGLRLISVLCQSSRKICESPAVSGLIVDVARFIEAVKHSRSALAIELFRETMFLWRIAGSYGLNMDCISRVSFLFELVQNWLPTAITDVAACTVVTSLYNLLEVTTHAGAPLSSSLSFDQIALFVNPAISMLGQVDLSDAVDNHFLQAASSMLHFLASYIQKLSKLFAQNSKNLYSIVEHFCSTVVLYILPQIDLEVVFSQSGDTQAAVWEFLFSFVRLIRICTHAHQTVGSLLRDCSLPSFNGGIVEFLWRLLLRAANSQAQTEHTPETLFQMRTVSHLQYVILQLLDDPCLTTDFIPSSSSTDEPQQPFQTLLQPDVGTLQKFLPTETPEAMWYQMKHDIALSLVQWFLPGEVVLVLDCLRKFVFHPTYWKVNHVEFQDSVVHTAQVCVEFYENKLFSDREINVSSNLILPIQGNISSLFLPFREQAVQYSLPLGPAYVISPINFYYDQIYNVSVEYGAAEPPQADEIVCYLQFWQLLEESDTTYMECFVPSELRFTSLMKVFLLSEDLFLEPQVQNAILGIFENLTKEGIPWSSAALADPKFVGFLEDFVAQFSSVSYGNAAFASVLFVFLRMEFPAISLIWRELFEMLALLENAQYFPMGAEGYLFPVETNLDVINLYTNSLINKKIARSSNLYWIAMHHISAFLFSSGTSSATKQDLFYRLVTNLSKELIVDLFTYNYDNNNHKPKYGTDIVLSNTQNDLIQSTIKSFKEIETKLKEFCII